MRSGLLIYGATGYSGRLMARGAVEADLRPVLAGRDAEKLSALARELGLEFRVARLDEPDRLDAALRDVRVVLHAAGPFSQTSRPMVESCLRTRVHYLDITAEVAVLDALARRDAEAKARGIMILPGVGFDVVPSDCLAAHVAQRVPGARRLAIGISGLLFASRGSAKTLMEVEPGVVRRNGAIVPMQVGAFRRAFDYGDGPRPSLNLSWGDVATAYYTTGIPDITVYVESTPLLEAMAAMNQYAGWLLRTGPWQAWLKAHAELFPDGPSEAERAARHVTVVAEAVDDCGHVAAARLRTPEAYTFTGRSGPGVAGRVLDGDLEIGFQTPARVYGSDFALSFPEVSREDLS